MLHSALPRACLASAAPGLGYLGSYFAASAAATEDIQHPYAYVQQHLDESYARLSEQRVLTWDTSAALASVDHHHHQPRRPSTPCPLDLSLKPPPTPSTPSARTEDCEAIEVDDEEGRRSREEARSHHSSEGRYPYSGPEEDLVVDDLDSQRSCSSAHSYHQLQHHQAAYEQTMQKKMEPVIMGGLSHQEAERLRIVQEMSLPGYPDAHNHHQKLLLASPTHLHSYHQLQLLQTPQHHHQHQHHQHHQIQGIHAPMTPPSTPSPPQCPRRKSSREEEASSPSGSSSTPVTPTTPKQNSAGSDKPRAKKKHARKLKFDEDTSSPVSGTVILGPDEAIVTGDIDPAFNIVEVTEEARAELAKIENRLGPYQCKLCRQLHEDAFQLAQHRCSRIAHVEYRCPECDKRFSCPANLASHRRWHKPRPPTQNSTTGDSPITSQSSGAGTGSTTTELACTRCDAKFSRQAALRKHVAAQHPSEQNNNNQDEGLTSLDNCKQQQQQQQQQIGSGTTAMEMA